MKYEMGIMKAGILRAIYTLWSKSSEWRLAGRRVRAASGAAISAFTSRLGWLRGAARNLIALVPAKLWLIAVALVCAGLWLQEHDANLRAGAALDQTRQQSAQRIAALKTQASTALRQANQRNAATIAQLEARRAALARQSAELGAHLRAMRERHQAQAQEIATLPAGLVQQRIQEELGESSVLSPQSSVDARSEAAANSGHKDFAEASVATPPHQPGASSQPATGNGQLALSELGQRRVLTALAERDACRDESALRDRQFANCSQRVEAGEAEIRTQADSLGKLNQALVAKDRILAEREAQYRAQLRAARGTWRGRAWRAMKWLAAGFVIGQAIR